MGIKFIYLRWVVCTVARSKQPGVVQRGVFQECLTGVLFPAMQFGSHPHSEHRFRHLPPNSARTGCATEGALFYFRATVHRRCQRPPTGLGTNTTVKQHTASKHARKHEARPTQVKKKERVPSRFQQFWFDLRKQRGRLSMKCLM